ncbi:hypothetical protein MNBD_BACTEROID03-2266 [hydrothermal vent metagenome]|uniref:Uncharacterized protein n=1 Tax=hydrothermal vent metagenome TaxID=652676 RepID=A0A3B0T794_9ZZZZ
MGEVERFKAQDTPVKLLNQKPTTKVQKSEQREKQSLTTK